MSMDLIPKNKLEELFDALIVLNNNLNILSVSNNTLDLLGYNENEMLKKPIWNFLKEPKQLVLFQFHFYKFDDIKTDIPDYLRNQDLTFITKNGLPIQVMFNITITKNDKGRVKNIIASASDVSQFTQVSRLLLEQSQSKQKLFQHIPDPLLVINHKNIITLRNAAYHNLLAVNANEMNQTEKELEHLIRENLISNVNDTQKPKSGIFIIEKNDEKLILEFNVIKNKNEDIPDSFIFTLNNITQKKIMEEKEKEIAIITAISKMEKSKVKELEQVNIKLDSTLKKLKETQEKLVHTAQLSSLGQLSSGISHELNQPLQTISIIRALYKKQLKKINISNDTFNKYDEDIKFAVNRMKKIIEHVKYFSRAEKGSFSLININDALNNSLILTQQQMKNRAIKLNLNLQEDLPLTRGDLRQIEQVSINMISNSIDAIDEDGQIDISSFFSGNEIIVKWKNNGPPIAKNIQESIFNPFFTTKDEGQGTGLGLSISFGIVQEHKGKLTVNSNEQITEFTMLIPVQKLDI